MQQNKKKTLAILFILITLFSMIAVTYAFFMGGVNNNNAQTAIIETGTMRLTFADGDAGVSGRLNFGDSITKLFTLENTGTVEATVDLYWKELTNSYLHGSLMYKLEYSSTENGTKSIAVNYSPVPTSETLAQEELATQQTVPVGTKYYYTLTITLVNSKTIDQTADLNASFASGFDIESVRKYPMLAASNTWYKSNTAKSTFTTINIVDSADEATVSSATESWPAAADANGDGTLDDDIMCYVNGTTLTIAGNGSGKVLANTDSSSAFGGSSNQFTSIISIEGANILDTSKIEKALRMFDRCSKLKSIEVSNWNVSNVTNMSAMFQGCSSITDLDVSNWNVSNVTSVSFMFHSCKNQSELDLSKWDVSKVTTFDHFVAQAYIKVLGVENWDTSSATNMYAMFNTAKNTSLDVSNWDTSKVIAFGQMFEYMTNLTKITGLENFNTSNGIDFYEMFNGCSKLTKLNLSSFDTKKATFNDILVSENGSKALSTGFIFNGMSNLQEIKLGKNFTFSGDGTTKSGYNYGVLPTPSSIDGYWYNQEGLALAPSEIPNNTADTYIAKIYPILASTSNWYKASVKRSTITRINIVDEYTPTETETESWDASSSQDGSIMCYRTGSEITIVGNGTGKIKLDANAANTFSSATGDYFTKLETINGIELLDTSSTTNMSYMFYSCSKLRELDLSTFKTEKVTLMRSMFNTCSALTKIDVSSFNTERVTDISGMFIRCTKLTTIDISNFNTIKVTIMDNVFKLCSDLTTIYASASFVTTSVTTSTNMFSDCTNLLGGTGTVYDANNITHTYARIDAVGSPGYFTEK